MITGVENRNEETEFYKESKEIFKDTSMNLREWMTNSQEVNNKIKLEDQIKKKGYHGNWIGFQFKYRRTINLQKKKKQKKKAIEPATTKREVLTALDLIYDLLEMVIPATINM